ncbi:MAG: GNAT family N-acetyltransferase [Roseomonas mucosa]|nr:MULTISPECIES: GNAT family N-acetyltransferase [Roseomonas]MBS5903841.1 GNAT family N-acetyltransferase [Acetobacteraceae bacterium]MCG7353757.1 GNAT family N-acetyltransferase [Roseomonas mucosa]MCG7359020.1 GNAT family N-acetyltransferase [Roseomonas mucosa]MDT8276819.1 GNAT family N-acetyltransferase [Roseomonas mucosa]MDT8288437.1 GNAT family N-acetyltransferase [Roseomonas mucosa]
MTFPRLLVTDTITPEMEAVIGGGLNAFNDAVTGQADRQPVAVVARDPGTGAILGGATGRSSLGLLFLDLFYLPPECRGAGLGSAILQAFEAEGRRRGCVAAVLYTISFQAPGFYERHGWRRFGEVACLPPGTSRIFLSKTL